MNQGAATVVLDLATAFERVSSPSCVGLGDALQILRGTFASAMRSHGAPATVRGMCGGASPAFLPASKWSSLLLRIVLQDALSEVMKVCPSLKLNVFVDDTTAFMAGRNMELAGITEKDVRVTRREV